MERFVLRRLLIGLLILVGIAWGAFWLQGVAWTTLNKQSAPLGEMLIESGRHTLQLARAVVTDDLASVMTPPGQSGMVTIRSMQQLLQDFFLRSLALLLLSMILGGLVGGLIGVLAAAWRRKQGSMGLIIISIIGVSTPSFFLGMLLQYLEITFYRHTGVRLLPVGGFGWDSHLVLPVLVLAARPIAQVARLSYVRLSEVLDQDFVRTARAKGLYKRRIWARHILPNALSTVLTAMGTSLRFSLSSLPVVEFLFGWPGVGSSMLTAIRRGQAYEATLLVLTMGALFVIVNILLDVAYRWLNPHLRRTDAYFGMGSAGHKLGDGLRDLGVWLRGLFRRRRRSELTPLPKTLSTLNGGDSEQAERIHRRARREAWRRALTRNPSLFIGAILALFLAFLVLFGPRLTLHPTSQVSLFLEIEGQDVRPPVAPNATYPLGTDAQGRDLLSLLLAGARRTMTLALLATVMRLAIGGVLGFVAGWNAGGRLDRFIVGCSEALSSFPALLMAMLLVYAIGIRQGMTTFVLALSLVGWSEVMQIVRGQVMDIRPQAYVEAARSTGLSGGQILSAHVLPNVWPTMTSVAFLEMGGVLMLLGELGFLGVFIGGGLAAEGDAIPTVVYYDIPEWSVMLANSWRAFRSYPWTMLYPALAFFLSILGFTFLGEGIRFLTERLTLSFRAIFNRYTILAALLLGVGAWFLLDANTYYANYQTAAQTFDADRALVDIETLAGETFGGRLSGTQDAENVAAWIAEQFSELGLQPAGETVDSYYQTMAGYYRNLIGMPELTFTSPTGERIVAVYGRDFVRPTGPLDIGGTGAGELAIVAEGPRYMASRSQGAREFGLTVEDYMRTDRVILRPIEDDISRVNTIGRSGTLKLAAGPYAVYPHYLLAPSSQPVETSYATVLITPEFARELVERMGLSMEEIEAQLPRERGDLSFYTSTGWHCDLKVPLVNLQAVPTRNVLAFWPGKDIAMDDEVIVISAYYDGLGRYPDGMLMPGANDNASGVATMLELIRTLKASDYQPKRTLIFAAWVGGERYRAVDYSRLMQARLGFAEAYEIVAGIELEGVGAGSGEAAVLNHVSSKKLQETLQTAARRVGSELDTTLPGLHDTTRLWEVPSGSVPSLIVSWAGSDEMAHTPADRPEAIDPSKLEQVGEMTALAVMVIAGDPAY